MSYTIQKRMVYKHKLKTHKDPRPSSAMISGKLHLQHANIKWDQFIIQNGRIVKTEARDRHNISHGYLDLTKSLRETKSATAGVKWNSLKSLLADMLNMGIHYDKIITRDPW